MNEMIDIHRIIGRLKEMDGIRYAVYTLPVVDLYIFGNEDSLKLAVFAPEIMESGIKQPFPRGETRQIKMAIGFLDSYMSGEKAPPPDFDLEIFSAREKAVYRTLLKVPFGRTISYGDLAEKAGIPRGARFAGNAMAKNLFPVFIPCHRVIKSDGRMGYYSGGIHIKEFLLAHERKK